MKKAIKFFIAILLTTSSSAYALSANDTLGDWRNSTYSEKSSLAQTMVKRLNVPGISASDLALCISETAGNGGLDHMKISETAAACAIMMQY